MSQLIARHLHSKDVALNIAARRKSCGLTQSQVARSLKLEKETVSRIETGKISVNIERLQEFANIFHCSLLDLIWGESEAAERQAEYIAVMLRALSDKERDAVMQLIRNLVTVFTDRAHAEKRMESGAC